MSTNSAIDRAPRGLTTGSRSATCAGRRSVHKIRPSARSWLCTIVASSHA